MELIIKSGSLPKGASYVVTLEKLRFNYQGSGSHFPIVDVQLELA